MTSSLVLEPRTTVGSAEEEQKEQEKKDRKDADNEDFWHVKLCDFGWSTHTINENRMTFCGTPDYLAPELINNIPYDDKIDNWAVGILTYELLTGASPFTCQQNNGQSSDIYRNITNVDLQYNQNYE